VSALIGRVAAGLLLVTACGTSASKADNAALCAGVAADLQGATLVGTPTQDQARAVGMRLDRRLTAVADPGLHDAVIRLHQHVHDIEVGWRRSDSAAATRAAERARKDAADVAHACKQPLGDFLS
jgi:enamine deaminase RidA (YjgF/YER057c/UK114 family)